MGMVETIVGGVAGAAIGFIGAGVIENYTDKAAQGKELTAVVCSTAYTEKAMKQWLVDCLRSGAGGGTKIGADKFSAGDPTTKLTAYIELQRKQEAKIDLHALEAWVAAGAIGTALVANVIGVEGLGSVLGAVGDAA